MEVLLKSGDRQLFESTSNIDMRIAERRGTEPKHRSNALFSGDREQPGSVSYSFYTEQTQ